MNKHAPILGAAVIGLALAGLSLLLAGASQAAGTASGTLFVSPGGSGTACSQAAPCSLQTALAQAHDGDTLYLAEGTYTGTGTAVITLTKSITLYGGWDGTTTTPVARDPDAHPTLLDGEGQRRVVYITGTIAPVLDGLVITHGNAVGLGGFSSYDAGGGIYVHQADVLIRNCTIISNAVQGGTGGGIVFIKSNGRLEASRVISNTATWGGGMRAISKSPTIRHSRFQGNTAHFGGGLYLMWSSATVEGNRFRDNEATTSSGGAIFLSGDSSTIVGNRIVGNRGSYGGGIGVASGSPAVISGNTILSNTAGRQGGGIIIQYNDARLYNNVIAHNEAQEEGAGVYIGNASPVLLHNTIAQNGGGDGAGVHVGTGAGVALTNTILVSHTVGITVATGSTATLEGTLWGSGAWANGADWGGDGAIVTGTVNLWGDPAFADPAGGDYHIGPGSAAVDAGVDAGVTTDVDGDPRPVGAAPDLGADEFQYKTYLPLVLDGP